MHSTTAFDLPTALIGEQFRLQIPSALDWIEPTIEHLTDRALRSGICDEARGPKLALALHEALTNAIVHGNLEVSSRLKEVEGDAFTRTLAQRGADPEYNRRTVTIDVDYDGERCRWTLTDDGPGFDVAAVLGRLEPTDENLELPSGRGILMMRAFLDEVRFENDGRRVVMVMVRTCKQEQRRHPRLPAQHTVRVAPIRADGSVDWEAAEEGLVRDFSAGGVAVLYKDLTRVDRIIIGLDIDGRAVYIPAEIRHWKALEAGMMEIGCRFLIGAPGEEAHGRGEQTSVQTAVDELLHRLHTAELTEDERRIHERVGYSERIGLEGATATDPVIAYARDLSKGGLAFITAAPVTLETKIVTLPRKSDTPLRIRVRVIRCDRVAEGIYDNGASFEGLEVG